MGRRTDRRTLCTKETKSPDILHLVGELIGSFSESNGASDVGGD